MEPAGGDAVLTLCLDTLNIVISDSAGLRANQSFCYWTGSGDYSSWTFDISRCQTDPSRASFYSLTVWTLSLGICHGCVSSEHLGIKVNRVFIFSPT